MTDLDATGLELRWLAQVPGVAQQRVAGRLLLPSTGGDELALDATVLRFVRDPDVRAEGRLALVPVPPDRDVTGRGAGSGASARTLGATAAAGLRVVALGWATVDAERTSREFGAALHLTDQGAEREPDPLLGATVRTIADRRLPGGLVALLEPSTEGRLAATLARDGEGPCALYVVPERGLEAWIGRARDSGVACSRASDGPFGRAVLVLGGSVAGPHLVVVDGVAAAATDGARGDAGRAGG